MKSWSSAVSTNQLAPVTSSTLPWLPVSKLTQSPNPTCPPPTTHYYTKTMQSYPTTSTNQYGIHPTSSDAHGHPTRPQPYFQGVCHLSLVPQVFAPNRIHLHLRDSPLSKGSIQETLCTLPPTRNHRNMDLQARCSPFPYLHYLFFTHIYI